MNASAKQHLDKAKSYVAKGDEFYAKAVDEIIAARSADPTLTNHEVGDWFGRSEAWVREIVQARTDSRTSTFRRGHQDRTAARKIAREQPDAFVEAFKQAPPEARQAIAREISSAPEVRAEARQRDVEADEARRPSPVAPRDDVTMYQFESRLATADSNLRQALKLLGEVDHAGDDEDILDQIGRLQQLVSVIEEAYRTGKSLDTWAAELYEGRTE